MLQEFKVNDTLSVETTGKAQVRVVRRGIGVVVIKLSEVADLVAALTAAADRHAAELAGEEWEDNPF
jgi:hypothetical protein